MDPGSVPVPPEARGREPPSSCSSLTFSLDGRRVSPLVLGLHCMGGARAPSRLDMSLCLSLFLRSVILPFHHFLYIRRSVTPIGLKPTPRFFLRKLAFLRQKKSSNRLTGSPRGSGVRLPPWGAPLPRGPLGHRLGVDYPSQMSQIFQKYSTSVFIPFGLRLIWGFRET